MNEIPASKSKGIIKQLLICLSLLLICSSAIATAKQPSGSRDDEALIRANDPTATVYGSSSNLSNNVQPPNLALAGAEEKNIKKEADENQAWNDIERKSLNPIFPSELRKTLAERYKAHIEAKWKAETGNFQCPTCYQEFHGFRIYKSKSGAYMVYDSKAEFVLGGKRANDKSLYEWEIKELSKKIDNSAISPTEKQTLTQELQLIVQDLLKMQEEEIQQRWNSVPGGYDEMVECHGYRLYLYGNGPYHYVAYDPTANQIETHDGYMYKNKWKTNLLAKMIADPKTSDAERQAMTLEYQQALMEMQNDEAERMAMFGMMVQNSNRMAQSFQIQPMQAPQRVRANCYTYYIGNTAHTECR
jgi:hypothetical protein